MSSFSCPFNPVLISINIVFRWGFLLAIALSLSGNQAFSYELDRKLSRYIKNGSVLVADDESIIYSKNSEDLFISASIFKLVTALEAFHYLGKSFHYKTEFYLNQYRDLTIRGFGDPLLVSEEWELIIQALLKTKKLPFHLRHLYLDDSTFNQNLVIPGLGDSLNSYDAINGALVTNFNTIYVDVRENKQVFSAEEQTPLTSIAYQLAKELPVGKQRVNISRQSQYVLPYLGELFQEISKKSNITFSGDIKTKKMSDDGQLIYTHSNSNQLIEIVEMMMLYSSNFIANQLFLSVGMQENGIPATLEKGSELMRHYMEEVLKIPGNQFQLVEGSGISRDNRITAKAMLQILKHFYPYRNHLTKLMGIRVKTGTLKGVYSLAGYLPSDRPLYFVIMLNQKRNYRDKILSVLLKESF